MKYLLFTLLVSSSNYIFAMKNSLPLFNSYSKAVQKNYIDRIKSFGNTYTPRTKHLNTDKTAMFFNRLILEESPYLLQHAHNPVNWRPWSPEAFKLAKAENKPIFLSIGYATCHWCHVMEHESFEDIKIAQFINENFIAIKVDRERRTAIDTYYMTGVQMMTGHGGWPMSNFLTPDAKPFFGGTYYNPTQFTTLLTRVNEVWHKQEVELRKQASQMDSAIKAYLSKSEKAEEIDINIFEKANMQILNMHDEAYGGFSTAPKFPQEPWLLYLLSQNNKTSNIALVKSLNKMQQGGVYDQVGGGFHRYATDNDWLTPHFEKMLYNQSQLSEVYTSAALNFNNPEYKRTAIAIFEYVLAEMMSQEHVFFSAGDADSEGEEGLFFTWKINELKSILNDDDFNWLQQVYHFSEKGNFEHRNILFLSGSLQLSAEKLNLSFSDFIAKLNKINGTLYKQRSKRIQPLIDDKVITSWNAQMIYSLAVGSQSFEKPEYLQAAVMALNYILEFHKNTQGFLVRNSLNGKVSNIHAELEDYAWVITALIKLYDIDGQHKWLSQAEKLIMQTEKLYLDKQNGSFFDNLLEDNIPNTSRIKKSEDSAIVSANGQMLIALARYYRRTGDLHIDELFTQSLIAFSGQIANNPISHTSMLRAKHIFDNGENSNIVYTANGKVKITSHISNNKIHLKFNIKDNWHINSNETNIKSLVPLSIKSKTPLAFSYPKAKITQLDFNENDLSTFEKQFEITADVTENASFPLNIKFNLQACSNKICLAPSKVDIKVYSFHGN